MRTVILAVAVVAGVVVVAQQPPSPADQRNRPARKVFVHFFGMEVTWK